MVGSHHTRGAVLKGCKIRKVENHWSRTIEGHKACGLESEKRPEKWHGLEPQQVHKACSLEPGKRLEHVQTQRGSEVAQSRTKEGRNNTV